MAVLSQLIIILAAITVFSMLAKWAKLPVVVGQIIAGLVVGPAVLNWVGMDASLSHLANLGVILIMFLAGLESDFGLLKRYITPAILVAIGGMVVPILVFTGLGLKLGWSLPLSLFWGILFSATSVAISAQVLKDSQKISSRFGTVIMGAAVIDDLLAILGWAVFTATFHLGKSSHGLLMTLGLNLVFLLSLVLLSFWLLPKIIPRFTHRRAYRPFVLLTVIALVLVTTTVAEEIGSSGVIAAFMLGLGLSMTPFAQQGGTYLNPLNNFFLGPIFFASIGLKMSFQDIGQQWGWLVLVTILAVGTKLLGAGVMALFNHFSLLESSIIGTAMVSRGEMALIIADIGLGVGLINSSSYTVLALVILLTTILTPIGLRPLLLQTSKSK